MHSVKISVRNLVEFILRSGDITASESGLADPEAMQEGSRIHKKLQKQGGNHYRAEVPLSITIPVTYDGISIALTVEGRADGVFPDADGQPSIDEIKGVYRHPSFLAEPVPVHRAQALCYGYIYASQNAQKEMGIRITYCHIPTEEIRTFSERLTYHTLEQWFLNLATEYAKWAVWQIRWQETRNASVQQLSFPFAYRDGQRDLVKGVYQSILRQKRLYIEAPTGVGKTISTIFPTVKSMGEGITDRIFYLTAKTITRTVAQETFLLLSQQGTRLKYITLTAKEKICILDTPQCDPRSCPRAAGHFDRINDAIYDLLTHEDAISRDTILQYADKYTVCPFEMSLDVSLWCDAIIGDYNYAFDPTACLKRFFAQETKNEYVFLIDEAHNLVDRAREMYSAALIKEDFLRIKKLFSTRSGKITRSLDQCNRALLALKRECETVQIYDPVEIEPFALKALRLQSLLEEFLHNRSGQTPEEMPPKQLLHAPSMISPKDTSATIPLLPVNSPVTHSVPSENTQEEIRNFYFELRFFLSIYTTLNDKYMIYSEFDKHGAFHLHLQCMDPSENLNNYLKKGRCAVFFSATLLPVQYYREQLAGREDDYAIYAPSPFPSENRLLMVARNVSTRYTRRNPQEYQRISDYILQFVLAKTGNYLVFFPSYRMLEDIREILERRPLFSNHLQIFQQRSSMTEEEREAFLSHFQDTPSHTTIGLCVMGGIFGEGIDLKDSRLIGAVVVGTGLPMVCTQNELYREYFEQKKDAGFSYAYQYPGMNKVLQAAGRVIRTDRDRGAILLLDERFLQTGYRALFPREWYPFQIVDIQSMKKYLSDFWDTAHSSAQKYPPV